MNDSQKFLDLNGLRHLAQKESAAYNSMVVVSDNEPQDKPYNKIWLKETTEEYTVPTYAEFLTVQNAFNDTLTLLAAVKTALQGGQDDTAISLLDTFLIDHGYLA